MAHFAELDQDNTVVRVLVVHNDELLDDGVEKEEKGVAFLDGLFGLSNWKQTSYSGSMRKNFAGIGFKYDESRDAFVPPKPFDSWVLIEETCRWAPPVPHPEDGNKYSWDEELKNWVEVPSNPV